MGPCGGCAWLSGVAVVKLEAVCCCLWGECGHLQRDALPQLLGLFASLQILQHVVELHHPHRREAKRPPGAADDVDEVVIVGRCQVDESMVDVLRREMGVRRLVGWNRCWIKTSRFFV